MVTGLSRINPLSRWQPQRKAHLSKSKGSRGVSSLSFLTDQAGCFPGGTNPSVRSRAMLLGSQGTATGGFVGCARPEPWY